MRPVPARGGSCSRLHTRKRKLGSLTENAVDTLAAEHGWDPPDWSRGVAPLPRPWFVSGIENLKASALVESPVCFRRRNLFVLSNFLSRA
jgi:hypothetical protein